MMKYFSLKFVCASLLFYMILCSPACIGDRIYFPIRVKDSPNTFGIKPNWFRESVVYVEVWAYRKTPQEKLIRVWEIRAMRRVPAKDFVVKVGEVPDGFEQILPSPLEKFYLISGERYEIGIVTDFKGVHPGGVSWIAE